MKKPIELEIYEHVELGLFAAVSSDVTGLFVTAHSIDAVVKEATAVAQVLTELSSSSSKPSTIDSAFWSRKGAWNIPSARIVA